MALNSSSQSFLATSSVCTLHLPPHPSFSSDEINCNNLLREQVRVQRAKRKRPIQADESLFHHKLWSGHSHNVVSTRLTLNRSLGQPRNKAVDRPLSLPVEQIFPILKTVEKHYGRAVDYCTYCLTNQSTSYLSKMAKKVESRITAHLFHSSNPISIIGFVATLNLGGGTSLTSTRT